MPHLTKAIEDARANGWVQKLPQFVLNTTVIANPDLLDPLFFQALGKARGWKLHDARWEDGLCVDCYKEEFHLPDWQTNWHRFIDHLAEGKDAESFFKDL